MRRSEVVGCVISVLWLILISVLVYINRENAVKMPLNEWGDFLAGMMAPLAFLWLIVGYSLQRDELKRNTEALLFQKEELAKHTEELETHSELLAKSVAAQNKQALFSLCND